MNTRNRAVLIGLVILGGLSLVGTAGALELEFTPQDQVLDTGEDGRLAVVLNDAIEVRTIELEVQYDATIIEAVSGGPGAAFDALPCYVWPEYTDEEAGTWYGFAVSFGTDCYVTGPGELFFWEFTAIADGQSPITALSIRLYDPDGQEIPDVELDGTTVIVGENLSAVGDVPAPAATPVQVVPNPFNPRTNIQFEMRESGRVRLEIYDLKGRPVSCLFDGDVAAGPVSIPWNGLTDEGREVPSGMYLYRLQMNHERCTGRLTLAR